MGILKNDFVKKFSACLLAFSGLGLANSAEAIQPNPDFTPVEMKAPSNNWYTDVGFDYYSVNLPTYRLPITFGGWVASNPPTPPPEGGGTGFTAGDTTAGNTTLLPFITLGYHLKNGSFLLPQFLDQESIEATYAQFNRSTKDMTFYSGAPGIDAGAAYGVIWKIDDTSVPEYNFAAWRIENSFIHASAHYHDLDLFMKANVRHLPNWVRSKVRVGIVGTTLDQSYAYTINATGIGPVHLPVVRTVGDDSVRARYLGLAAGDNVEIQFAPACTWFFDGVIQGLYAAAFLTTNQVPDQLASQAGGFADYVNNIRVSSSVQTFTYRAKVSTGINVYPKLIKNNSESKVSFFAGLDYFGYVPQSVTVAEFGAKSPHIEGQSMLNFYVGASLTIPIA